MRTIKIKYLSECKKCNTTLDIDTSAMYEKSMGVFCMGCEPKDTEDIRHYRQIKASLKAERYNGWAEKREKTAEAQLNSYPEIRRDIAFCTQPGRIPFRERMNMADDKAHESLKKAKEMRDKAESLSHVRVKGDAEKATQAFRDKQDTIINVGSKIFTCFGNHYGTVLKKNKKTYTIQSDSGAVYPIDKTFVKPIREGLK